MLYNAVFKLWPWVSVEVLYFLMKTESPFPIKHQLHQCKQLLSNQWKSCHWKWDLIKLAKLSWWHFRLLVPLLTQPSRLAPQEHEVEDRIWKSRLSDWTFLQISGYKTTLKCLIFPQCQVPTHPAKHFCTQKVYQRFLSKVSSTLSVYHAHCHYLGLMWLYSWAP